MVNGKWQCTGTYANYLISATDNKCYRISQEGGSIVVRADWGGFVKDTVFVQSIVNQVTTLQ